MNTGVKVMFLLYFLVFASILSIDFISVYEAETEIKRALDRAIDGGIIYGTIDDDMSKGKIRLDEERVRQGVTTIIKKNLSLDASLSNDAYRKGSLNITITYHNESPRVEANYNASVQLISGKFVGLDEYDIRVNKKTPYLSEYK